MIFKRKTSPIIIVLILAEFIVAEEYNLFGIPGQGYVVEVNLGHPHQKVRYKLSLWTNFNLRPLAMACGPAVL